MKSPGDSINMTRADLYDWVQSHGCQIQPLPEHKARVIWITNPVNNQDAFINLPINETPIRDYSVYRCCTKLGIPVPTCTTYCKPLHDKIETDHNLNTRRGRK